MWVVDGVAIVLVPIVQLTSWYFFSGGSTHKQNEPLKNFYTKDGQFWSTLIGTSRFSFIVCYQYCSILPFGNVNFLMSIIHE